MPLLWLALFECFWGLLVRILLMVTSIRMTAYVPYTRLKGVSFAGVRIVVLYVHRNFFNSSAQFLLASPNLFLIPFTKVWLVTSTRPFAWGCTTNVKFCLILLSWHHFLKGLSSNYFPLSLMIVCGRPKRHTICLHMNFITFFLRLLLPLLLWPIFWSNLLPLLGTLIFLVI